MSLKESCHNEDLHRHLEDVTLDIQDPEAFQEGAADIARRIRPEWKDRKLGVKTFSDGITNKLVGVYDAAVSDGNDMVLIRGYGIGTYY